MRNTYEERAKAFIRSFAPMIHRPKDIDPWNLRPIVRAYNAMNHRAVRMNYGACRVVLITSDYVVKLDYGDDGYEFGTCEDECATYATAVEDGFDHLLAKITRYEYNGLSWYIMPRISFIGRENRDINRAITDDEFYWICEHIGDLHHGNYGWKNGRPIIIDYACDSMHF